MRSDPPFTLILSPQRRRGDLFGDRILQCAQKLAHFPGIFKCKGGGIGQRAWGMEPTHFGFLIADLKRHREIQLAAGS